MGEMKMGKAPSRASRTRAGPPEIYHRQTCCRLTQVFMRAGTARRLPEERKLVLDELPTKR